MKINEIVLKQLYRVRLRGKVTIVDVRSLEPGGGWNGVDIATQKPVRIGRVERILCACNRGGRAIDLPKPKPGTCKLCGCWDAKACPGGCSWVDEDHTLCTACVERTQGVLA